jgi:hypothetical protein
MKKLILTLFVIIAIMTHLHAQTFEVSVQANTGLFHYSGSSSTKSSLIDQGQSPKQSYTYNPYGSLNGFSYGAGIQAQYVTKIGFIVGLQTGYEILRSKVNVDMVLLYQPNPGYLNTYGPTAVKGNTFLQDQSIDLNPYIGYRIKAKKINIDLLPGIDMGFNVSSYDKGKVTLADGTVYQTDYKRENAPVDVRLKFGAAVHYKRWGITASYAHGLTNYIPKLTATLPTYNGDNNTQTAVYKANSEILRFGITYRIL